MKINDTATLSIDIKSSVKKDLLLGKSGDLVQVISIRDKVVIVKGKERFSVKIQDLKIIENV